MAGSDLLRLDPAPGQFTTLPLSMKLFGAEPIRPASSYEFLLNRLPFVGNSSNHPLLLLALSTTRLKKRTWGAAVALCSALMRMLYCRTVAAMLAEALGCGFAEADDNHSLANKGEHSGKEHLAELQEKDAPNLMCYFTVIHNEFE
uniref:Uncharacterized protein n=1 Tax=Aegilops tauschii TaxID=37682 RepID=N1QZX4_AEGTA